MSRQELRQGAEVGGAQACPLCGEGRATAPFLRYGSLQWYRCPACAGGWQWPYASELEREEEDIGETYGRYAAHRALFDAVAEEKAGWLLGHRRSGMAVLEIGPGVGAVARAVRRREPAARVLLVEPRAAFADALRADGFAVFDGDPGESTAAALAAARAEGAPVVAFLDNVLEHVPWPGEFLGALDAGALPGSRLLVEVPNERGLGWRAAVQDFLRGERKPPTFPGHINLFTAPSLARLVLRVTGQRARVSYHPVRRPEHVAYLTQDSALNARVRLALAVLNVLPVDRLLGVAYWLRAEAAIGRAGDGTTPGGRRA